MPPNIPCFSQAIEMIYTKTVQKKNTCYKLSKSNASTQVLFTEAVKVKQATKYFTIKAKGIFSGSRDRVPRGDFGDCPGM